MYFYSVIGEKRIAILEIQVKIHPDKLKEVLVLGGAAHVKDAKVYQCTEKYADSPTEEINLLPNGKLCTKEEFLNIM